MAYETEYTDFDPQEDSSACLTLGLATDIVESRYLRDFSTAEPEEKQQILKDLTTFLEQLLRQPQISGSADAAPKSTYASSTITIEFLFCFKISSTNSRSS